MLKDRGTMKWTSLMLPEHIQLLKKVWDEDKKIEMPILDEQEQAFISEQLVEAKQSRRTVQLTIYENGLLKAYDGEVTEINPHLHTIKLNLSASGIIDKKISFSQIIRLK